MSYILEALRRAEAEREREAGKVPTLSTPARTLPLPDDDELAPRRPAARGWLWPAVGAAALAGVGGWWLLRGGEAPVTVTARAPEPAASAVPGSAPVAALPQPVPAPVSAPPAVAPSITPAAPAPAAATVAQAVPGSAPVVQSEPVPVTKPAPVPARPAQAPAAVAKPSTPSEAAPPAKPRRFAELTEAQRREIPSLTFGGSMHSPDPAARMVIVNGQVRREGETVAPGLVLEQIGVRHAVFAFKGLRFEMPL